MKGFLQVHYYGEYLPYLGLLGLLRPGQESRGSILLFLVVGYIYLTREFHEELFIVVAAIYVGLCFFCLALLALMLALVLLILGPIFSFADGDGW